MTRRPPAYLEDLPQNMVGELLRGVVHASQRRALPHARAATKLGAKLDGPFDEGRDGPGGWLLLDEPELRLADDVIVPDIAGWRRERMPTLPTTTFATVAPDWVCEVLAPSTMDIDRTEKLPIYAREHVRHVWLLDPLAQTFEILRLDGPSYRLVAARRRAAQLRAEPFEAIELELATLWTA
jgi:Uma2 family endonuclease